MICAYPETGRPFPPRLRWRLNTHYHMSVSTPLRILVVEDNPDDMELLTRELARGGLAPVYHRVDTAQAMKTALAAQTWDLVIADYALPSFSGSAALEILKQSGFDIPFIIVSGSIGEETAVSVMKAGAHDYIMKSALGRLIPAVQRELQEAAVRRGKRQSDHALREANRRLHALSSRMLEIQEQERRQLARELHDEIGQVLTAVKIDLQTQLLRIGAEPDGEGIEGSIKLVDGALNRVRSLSLDLRPSQLDDLGLQPALRWYLDRQARSSGLAVEFKADLPPARLDPGVETACFRIAQEAMTNVLRHAGASRVRVDLRARDGEIELVVEDDGRGFNVPAAQARAASGESLGLLGMEERAELAGGRIKMLSAPGKGTRIEARFPGGSVTDTPTLPGRLARS
jgi:signal transduction histidine kinase